MQKLILHLLFIPVILLSHPVLAEAPKGYPFLAYDDGLIQAAKSGKKIFLYFGRYGCGWCDKTNKETFSDNGIKKLYTKNYVLIYIDAESGDRLTLPDGERITEMELGTRLNVFATPMFVYLESNGALIFKAPGYKTKKDFEDLDEYVQGNHYKTKSLSEFLAGTP